MRFILVRDAGRYTTPGTREIQTDSAQVSMASGHDEHVYLYDSRDFALVGIKVDENHDLTFYSPDQPGVEYDRLLIRQDKPT